MKKGSRKPPPLPQEDDLLGEEGTEKKESKKPFVVAMIAFAIVVLLFVAIPVGAGIYYVIWPAFTAFNEARKAEDEQQLRKELKHRDFNREQENRQQHRNIKNLP